MQFFFKLKSLENEVLKFCCQNFHSNFFSEFSFFDIWMAAIHSFSTVVTLIVDTNFCISNIQFENWDRDISSSFPPLLFPKYKNVSASKFLVKKKIAMEKKMLTKQQVP